MSPGGNRLVQHHQGDLCRSQEAPGFVRLGCQDGLDADQLVHELEQCVQVVPVSRANAGHRDGGAWTGGCGRGHVVQGTQALGLVGARSVGGCFS